jgi:ankyrin repeat protein
VLLAAGAPIDAVDNSGLTPLCTVSSAGDDADMRVVDALITRGAHLTMPNRKGDIPLHVACEHNYTKTASCLLRANPAPEHVNAVGHAGARPLHLAVRKGHGWMVSLLLAAGADVAARDMEGSTPLLHAVEGKHVPLVKQLLEAGGDPGAADEDGGTHLAAAEGHTPILQALLAAMVARPGGGGGVDALCSMWHDSPPVCS